VNRVSYVVIDVSMHKDVTYIGSIETRMRYMKRKSALDVQRGESLALFLNTTSGGAKHARILKILELCQRLEPLLGQPPLSIETEEGFKEDLRRNYVERDLNTALSKYHFRAYVNLYYRFPVVSARRIKEAWKTNPDLLPRPIGQRFSVRWLPVGRNTLTKAQVAAWKANSKALPLGEMGAVQAILDLAASGLLAKLRRCMQPHAKLPDGFCGRWYMAMKSNKDCCSAACRVRKSHRKEGFKEKHRKYMSEWYWHPQVVKKRKAAKAAKKKAAGKQA
jgi:hypothetical protein